MVIPYLRHARRHYNPGGFQLLCDADLERQQKSKHHVQPLSATRGELELENK